MLVVHGSVNMMAHVWFQNSLGREKKNKENKQTVHMHLQEHYRGGEVDGGNARVKGYLGKDAELNFLAVHLMLSFTSIQFTADIKCIFIRW